MQGRYILGVLVALLSSAPVLAETGYVRAREAKVMSAPSATAESLMALRKGAEVEIVARQGRWVKVTVADREGWISALLVGTKPPMKRISVLEGEDADTLEQSARRRASTATSAAAARGLRGDERARQSDHDTADFGAVREMESMDVSEDEAAEFMESPN